MKKITNNNLYLLLPGKIARVVEIYSRGKNIPPLDAMLSFYRSATYKKLEKEETKYWRLGPVALYQEYAAEEQIK
jgi:hypothetical protein